MHDISGILATLWNQSKVQTNFNPLIMTPCLLAFVVVNLVFILSVKSQSCTVNCTDDSACNNNHITCENSCNVCEIRCLTENSCALSHFSFNHQKASLLCSNVSACVNASVIFEGTVNNVASIVCSDTLSYTYIHFFLFFWLFLLSFFLCVL